MINLIKHSMIQIDYNCKTTFFLSVPGQWQKGRFFHTIQSKMQYSEIHQIWLLKYLKGVSFICFLSFIICCQHASSDPLTYICCKYIADLRSPRSLCQGCIQHNVAEGEKEVDTAQQHASDNDEKKESFEDLPEHLKLGEDFTLRVTVLQAYGVSPEYTDLFTQFK